MKRLAILLCAVFAASTAQATVVEVDFSGTFHFGSYVVTEFGDLRYDTTQPEITQGSDTFRLLSADLTYEAVDPTGGMPPVTLQPAFDSSASEALIGTLGGGSKELDFFVDNLLEIHISTLSTLADHVLPDSFYVGPASVGINSTIRDTQGQVSYEIVDTTPPSSPVPEPSGWMMLIAGFALIGGTMRRSNGLSAFPYFL